MEFWKFGDKLNFGSPLGDLQTTWGDNLNLIQCHRLSRIGFDPLFLSHQPGSQRGGSYLFLFIQHSWGVWPFLHLFHLLCHLHSIPSSTPPSPSLHPTPPHLNLDTVVHPLPHRRRHLSRRIWARTGTGSMEVEAGICILISSQHATVWNQHLVCRFSLYFSFTF